MLGKLPGGWGLGAEGCPNMQGLESVAGATDRESERGAYLVVHQEPWSCAGAVPHEFAREGGRVVPFGGEADGAAAAGAAGGGGDCAVGGEVDAEVLGKQVGHVGLLRG